MSPVSGSKTGMEICSSDVTGMHQITSNSLGNLSWAACDGVTLRACLSYDIVRQEMGCSDGWEWERIASFLGGTLGAGSGKWS